jgi:hypothetical protein
VKACKTCHGVYDETSLPVKETALLKTATAPAGTQEDIFCPGCGSLLVRHIDGEEIGASFKDNRGKEKTTPKPKKSKKKKKKKSKAEADAGSKANASKK